MKNALPAIALLALLPLASAHAATDYLLELGGVEGESTASAPATTTAPERAVTTTAVDDPALPRTAPVTTSAFAVVGTPFVLDASKSADDGVIRTFMWRQVSGPTAVLSDAKSATASFTPTVAGTYVFELSVTDSAGQSSVAQVSSVAVSGAASGAGSPPSAGSGTGAGTVAAPSTPQPGSVDVFMEIEGVKGESTKGAEPPSPPLEVAPEPEALTPDFSILLGGGSSEDDEATEGQQQAAAVLLQGAQEEGLAAESISLNYEKITTKVSTPVKMFGVIPVTVTATVEIDAASRVRVRFPWWTFLASGKDGDGLGARVFTALSNVLKTKHDTIKNAIGNIR